MKITSGFAGQSQNKKTKNGECLVQMLRIILHTSVVQNFIINATFTAFKDRSDDLLRYTGICLVVMAYFIAAAFLYGKLCKKLSLRLCFSVLSIFLFNIPCLALIWKKYGSGSSLFKNSAVLTALSLIVFAGDLIYFIYSAVKWKAAEKRVFFKQEKPKTPKKSNPYEELDDQTKINAAELPDGMLKRVTVFFPAVCSFIIILAFCKFTPNDPIELISTIRLLSLIPCVLAATTAGYKLYVGILSRDKYILHKAAEEEENT